MATAYFDVANTSDRGFTLRFHYETSAGYIKINNIQLQSTIYNNKWFPKGTIKINGETVLEMSYKSPATHMFTVGVVGETWYDIQKQTGAALPVSNATKITTASAQIEVDIELYRDSNSTIPKFSGTETVKLLSGLVYIANGSSFDAYEVYIANGTTFERYMPYIADGSQFVLCN